MAVLAAIAFDDLARGVEERPKGAGRVDLWPLAVPATAGVLVSLVLKLQPDLLPGLSLTPWLAPDFDVLCGVLLCGANTALVVLAALGHRTALSGLILLTATDLTSYALESLWREPPQKIASLLPRAVFPPESLGYRIAVRRSSLRNLYASAGFRVTGGEVALAPRRVLDYGRASTLRLAGAGWDLDSRGTWTPIDQPLPRSWLVLRAEGSADPRGDLDSIDPRSIALVTPGLLLRLAGGEPGEVTVVRDEPGAITLAATTKSRQLLVLAESFHRGWRVLVDGRPRPVIPIDGDFMGCALDPGEHRVVFRFLPGSLRVGASISAAGFVLLAVFSIAAATRPRRSIGERA
jgi:hypothetical protein